MFYKKLIKESFLLIINLSFPPAAGLFDGWGIH